MRLVQGLQARMPDRRRHGADEDRVPRPLQGDARLSLRDRAIAYLPRYAPWAGRVRAACQLRPRTRFKGLPRFRPRACAAEVARRLLPRPHAPGARRPRPRGRAVRRHLQPLVRAGECARRRPRAPGGRLHGAHGAAARERPAAVLRAHAFSPPAWSRKRSTEAQRTLDALRPLRRARHPGHRPRAFVPLFLPRRICACCSRARRPSSPGTPTSSRNSWRASRATLEFKEMNQEVLLHGHCHQKAFDAMPAVERVLGWCRGSRLKTIESSCCGMAGSFGYEAEHYDVSMKMAEMSLLPRGAGRRRCAGRRRRHELPAPDRRRRGPRSVARRAAPRCRAQRLASSAMTSDTVSSDTTVEITAPVEVSASRSL